MHALVFDDQLMLRDIPPPRLQRGEAIIAPHLVGICATDLEIMRGYKGFRGVLGHEWVGTVIECEDPAWVGQRVVGEINVPCGACATCRRGNEIHCSERTATGIMGRNGALAEQFSLPVTNLYRVPLSLRDEEAVFAEPLAAAMAITDAVHIHPSDRVAVVGDGKLGLLVTQVLRLTGCDLTVIGRHPERWDLLQRQHVHAITSDALNEQRNFDVVVDCTGKPCGLDTARALVRPRGTLVLKSTFANVASLDLSSLVVDEIQLIGSRCGPFAPALRLLQHGLIETKPLISAIYPLDRSIEAFAAAQGSLKVLINVWSKVQQTQHKKQCERDTMLLAEA